MTTRTEDHEIEDRLRRTFQAVAATTKVHEDLLDEPAEVIRLETRRPRRPYRLLATAAAVALAAGVTAVLVSRDPTERTIPPATDSTPALEPTNPPYVGAFALEPGRHAVLGNVEPLVWLETEENEPLADMTIGLERWVDGDRQVTVIHGGNNLANLPCDDVCAVGGPTAVYQSGLTQEEVDAIAADPSTLAAGPFRLVQQSSVWPETANTVSIWGEHENVDETGPGASVTILSFPGVAVDFNALAHLPVEKIEINDRPALYVTGLFPRDVQDHPEESDGRDAIIWSPTDEVTVAVLVEGFDREQLTAFANDVVLVGDSAWAELVANPINRDANDVLGERPVTLVRSENADWALGWSLSGGLDTGVTECFRLQTNQSYTPWEQCGAVRLSVGVTGFRNASVVAGTLAPGEASVRLGTSDGQMIVPHVVDTPNGATMFAEELPIDLGPVTVDWLDADGDVVDSQSVSLDQDMVGG